MFDKNICPVCDKPTIRHVSYDRNGHYTQSNNEYDEFKFPWKYNCLISANEDDGHEYKYDFLGGIYIIYKNLWIVNSTSSIDNFVYRVKSGSGVCVLTLKGSMIPPFKTEELLEEFIQNYNIIN